MKNETPKNLRILTNMAFGQCQIWAEQTDSIYNLEAYEKNPVYLHPLKEAWLMFRRRKHYDVVHTMGARPSLYYGLLCMLLGGSSRQLMTEIFFDHAQPHRLMWRLKTKAYNWIAARSYGVITNSSSEIAVTRERMALPETAIRYLPLHTNIEDPHYEAPTTEIILSAGRSLRDYDTLIKAADKIIAPFTIICGHDDLQGVSIPEHVTLLREIPYPDYLKLLSSCKFVVLPLDDTVRSTGQVVMLTAMGLGKAVITTEAAGTIDYILHGENGLLVPMKDSEALAAAINQLLADPASCEKMAKNALEDIKQHFTIEEHGRERLALIDELYKQAH